MKSMPGLSPKLPLLTDDVDGSYALNKTIREAVAQNLKNLILTSPGEKIMDPMFGVGLNGYIFENFNSTIVGRIKTRIYKQVEKYLPFIEILDVLTAQGDPTRGESEQLLKIKIDFLIKPLDETDILIINSDAN
tara:strand:+ start:781 stop:1182 length:402 start_codon:yes stop_codon:yes gene_type:complete